MRWSTTLATVTAGAAVALAASGTGAQATSCTAGRSEARAPSAITATNITCANARTIAAKVARPRSAGGCVVVKGRSVKLVSGCVRLGYRCSSRATKHHTLRITCVSGGRSVRFTY
jgi:hypothetical protein